MGTGHVVAIQEVGQDEIVDMALVAGDQNKRALAGHVPDALQHGLVHDYIFEDRVQDPTHHRRRDPNRGGAVFGGDLIDAGVGFLVDLLQGQVAFLGVLLHEGPQARLGQDILFELFHGLEGGAGDALPVAVGPQHQVPAQVRCQ